MATKIINLGTRHGVQMWIEREGTIDSMNYQGTHFYTMVVLVANQHRIYIYRRDNGLIGLPTWMNEAQKAAYPTYDSAKKMARRIAGYSMNAAERAEADAEDRKINEEMARESGADAR